MTVIAYATYLCVCALHGSGVCEVEHSGSRGWYLFCVISPVLTFNLGLIAGAIR